MKESEELDSLYARLLLAKNKEEVEEIMIQIIKLVPNNYDLGDLIRSLYNKNNQLNKK